MTVLKYLLLGAIGLIVLTFALIGVLYTTRGSPVSRVRTAAGGREIPRSTVQDSLFRRTMELHSNTPLLEGNEVEVMINGEQTYPKLWQDLRAARSTITLQMYYCKPGKMADMMKDILVERSRAGVRVLFLLDAFGAQDLTEDYLDSLRKAGVNVARFRPVHWYSVHKAQSRSHIRVVAIDGMVGYTGGFGLDDKWFGDGRQANQWRDSNVRFKGPAVLQLQATFASGWAEATGELLSGAVFFPVMRVDDGGERLAGLMHAAPTLGSTAAERFLALSIASAASTLYISNAYFVPDDDFRRLLKEAAKRGVDVRVLTTGQETDVKMTWRAGRSSYEQLLAAGVKIYEYVPTMMHAKTLVADGMWSSVGTMNFDNRSLVFNDESNLNVLDPVFGARLEAIFMEDLRYSKEIKLEEFRHRPVWQKLVERGAAMLSRML